MAPLRDVPDAIARPTAGLDASVVATGMSSARVSRLERDGVPVYYLKAGPRPRFGNLLVEYTILDWLGGRFGAPRIAAWASEGGADYLLTTVIPGANAAQLAPGVAPAQVVGAMAQVLRELHRSPIGGCPIAWPVDAVLAAARTNVAERLVNVTQFDAERLGRSPKDLLDEALATRPPDAPSLVFTHGDPSVPNFIMQGAEVSGVVDWAWAGLADPYSDLAIAAGSIAHNYGPDLVGPFFAAYGLDEPDQARLAFFRLTSEFF